MDVETGDGTILPLFLRYDRLDPAQRGDPFTLHREAHFYRAFADSPVPVPRIVGVHPTEQAILSERVPGQAWFSRIRDEDERVSVASDFMRILAEMHRVDPHRLQLPDQHPETGLRQLVAQEIDTWETVYRDAGGKADPLIELALTWVKRNIPDVDGPVVIVQGDTGPGNFLYENGRVTAVLDLELGHLATLTTTSPGSRPARSRSRSPTSTIASPTTNAHPGPRSTSIGCATTGCSRNCAS